MKPSQTRPRHAAERVHDEPESFAFEILCQATGLAAHELIETFDNISYEKRYKKKRSGNGYREYFVPHPALLKTQRRLLRKFLYQLTFKTLRYEGVFDPYYLPFFSQEFQGFIPGRSHVHNSLLHTAHFTHFVMRIDLKDAFPSITNTMLRSSLRELITYEIKSYREAWARRKEFTEGETVLRKILRACGPRPTSAADWTGSDAQLRADRAWMKTIDDYLQTQNLSLPHEMYMYLMIDSANRSFTTPWKKHYDKHPLFPKKRFPELRNLILNKSSQDFLDLVMNCFIEQLISLTTHQGALVQGGATSGFLFNLVIRNLGILSLIKKFLKRDTGLHRTISLYADDLTIGFEERPSQEIIAGISAIIEAARLKVNTEKTRVYDRRTLAPPITGQILIRKYHQGDAIEPFKVYPGGNIATFQGVHGGAIRRHRTGGTWIEDALSIPKKTQRKMRAVFHRGATLETVTDSLHSLISGYRGWLHQVYGDTIDEFPNALRIPLRNYLRRFDKNNTTH